MSMYNLSLEPANTPTLITLKFIHKHYTRLHLKIMSFIIIFWFCLGTVIDRFILVMFVNTGVKQTYICIMTSLRIICE